MAKYFRIKGYIPTKDLYFIIDSNGRFEKLWQFSSYLINKGCKILEVNNEEAFLEGNIPKMQETNKIVLRAYSKDKPSYFGTKHEETYLKTIKFGDKTYIPDKNVRFC